MSALARVAVAVGAVLCGRPAVPPPRLLAPRAEVKATVGQAVDQLLRGAGGVVAFGEVHQDTSDTVTRSALARFTDELLPRLAPRASHLIVETWMTDGRCGAAEARVTEDVERTTERPPQTESELVRLLRRAKELGVAPHVLAVSCQEYRQLAGAQGRVDYHRLLTMTGEHLRRAVVQALLLRRPPERPLVLVYGGALHNDLYPSADLAAYSFGPAIDALTHGDYREIDLYVPEFVGRTAALRASSHYALWRRAARPGAALVIPRSARSAMVFFPRTGAAPQR